jgi:hypothetical protein
MATKAGDMRTSMMRIIEQIVAAAGQTEAYTTDAHFHLRIENEPYMALVIESWATPDALVSEKRRVSVAHYFTQHGDAIADPECEMTDLGYPIELDQQGHRTPVMWRAADGRVMVRPAVRQSVASFLNMWARNIRAQGFLKAAKAQAKASK